MRKTILKSALAAILLGGAAFSFSGPAQAEGFGLSIGPGGGVSFSVSTGGYCDRWGCPDDYWGYPVFYGPVFYDGVWYRGPMYYRMIGGNRYYWVHGGWHRDHWRGPRPSWARNYHYGPALGLDYYRSHGFHVSDHNWQRYQSRHGHHDRHDNHNRGGYDRGHADRGRHDAHRENGWDLMRRQATGQTARPHGNAHHNAPRAVHAAPHATPHAAAPAHNAARPHTAAPAHAQPHRGTANRSGHDHGGHGDHDRRGH